MATRSSMPPPTSSSTQQQEQEQQQQKHSVDHQVIDISKRVPDKAIRINRDYSRGDGITRFSTDYPPILAGRVR